MVSVEAKTNLLPSFFGDRVYAETSSEGVDLNQNSQTLTLLQRDVPFDPTSAGNISENQIDENSNIKDENALLPKIRLGTGTSDVSLDSSPEQISVYSVRKGDSLSAIAQMFGVSVNTVLAANDMKKGDKLTEGSVLLILPISGIEHVIKKGETLESIAKLYKADINDIVIYNDISSDVALVVGDKLMIPDGYIDEGGDKPSPNLNSSVIADKNYYATHPTKSVAGYFINPVPTGHKTQGLHGPGNRGIDIGAPTGTPIYASAPGTVLITSKGWSGGYGNMVIVQHPNGTKTLYAHMSKIGTSTGANVRRGQIIGYVGSTGRSTGPHIHFEVFNAKNPGADWSWKN